MSGAKTYMKREWLYHDHEEELYSWVMSAETKMQPRCKSCEISFELSAMGTQAVWHQA